MTCHWCVSELNDGGYQRVGLLYSFWAAVTKYLTEITREERFISVHGFRNSSPSQRERHGGVREGMVGCISFGVWRMLTS